MLEVVGDDLRSALCTPEVASDVVDHVVLVSGALATHGVGLDVLVEIFIGIELRTVAGKVEQFQRMGMLLDPTFDFDGEVHGMTVQNQKHFPIGVPHQSPQKLEHDCGSEPLFEYHECRLAPVGDRGDHVAAEAFARAGDHRRLATQSVARASLMIASQAHFVAPVDLCVFALRTAANGRL